MLKNSIRMQVVTEAVSWKYRQLKNGAHTVKVRITNYRNVDYIKTNLACREEHWDAASGLPTTEHPEYRKLFKKIEDIKESVDFELNCQKRIMKF